MEADRMVNLKLTQENLDNEKKIVTEELRLRTENSPEARVLIAAQKALLGSHPYAFDPSGSKEDVAAATVESCRAFYGAHYHPNHAHLVVVGPVDAAAVLAEARRVFDPVPAGGTEPREIPPLLTWTYPEETDLQEDLPPVEAALMGFPLPPPDSEDADALDVLGQMLSGGSVDLFHEEHVRLRHRAIEAGTQVFDFRRGGGIVFYAVSLPYRRKATAFRDMLRTRETLSGLAWLTDESLLSAKRTILRRELRQAYDAEARADAIGRARWWLGDERRAFDRVDRIRKVTREQVAAAYRTYVGSARPIRIYLRPEHVPLMVRLFGWLYPLVAG
jgi:zinc protease